MQHRFFAAVAVALALTLGACSSGSGGKAKAKVKPAPSTTTTTWSPAQRAEASAWCREVTRVKQEHAAKNVQAVPDTVALATRFVPLAGVNANVFRGVATNLQKLSPANAMIVVGIDLTEWQGQCQQLHLL
jgi:ABC-type glycerol-3-phosphate transport system substrate-binding protein